MIKNDVENRLRKLLENIFPMNIENVDIDDDLRQYGLDSMQFVKLVVAVETEFNFEFDDEEINFMKFRNLRFILNYICNKQYSEI